MKKNKTTHKEEEIIPDKPKTLLEYLQVAYKLPLSKREKYIQQLPKRQQEDLEFALKIYCKYQKLKNGIKNIFKNIFKLLKPAFKVLGNVLLYFVDMYEIIYKYTKPILLYLWWLLSNIAKIVFSILSVVIKILTIIGNSQESTPKTNSDEKEETEKKVYYTEYELQNDEIKYNWNRVYKINDEKLEDTDYQVIYRIQNDSIVDNNYRTICYFEDNMIKVNYSTLCTIYKDRVENANYTRVFKIENNKIIDDRNQEDCEMGIQEDWKAIILLLMYYKKLDIS